MEAKQMFSIFVFIFIVVTSAERLWWTYIRNSPKEKGEVTLGLCAADNVAEIF